MSFDARACIASLHAFESDLLVNVRQSLDQSAAMAWQLAKTTTRFSNCTGNLRASIQRGSKKTFTQFVRAGDTKAFYAPYVEFGTSRMYAREFMLTARNKAEKALLRFVQAGTSHALH